MNKLIKKVNKWGKSKVEFTIYGLICYCLILIAISDLIEWMFP